MQKDKIEEADLKKYYKKILKCVKCGKSFGSDKAGDFKVCPLCIRNSRINKKAIKNG